MARLPVFDVAGPGLVVGLLAFGVAFVFILFLLIVLVETVALQLLRWGDFRSSLKASVLMNLASTCWLSSCGWCRRWASWASLSPGRCRC
jgi:hypothetical protein